MAPGGRAALLQPIATTIAGYRQGEISPPTVEHVDRWVSQFEQFGADARVQTEILREMDHLLRQLYFSKEVVVELLSDLLTATDLTGSDPPSFWRSVNFLRLQIQGSSQDDMLEIFDSLLQSRFGFQTADCGTTNGPYLYLDDWLFTGNRIRGDLTRWLHYEAPDGGEVYVIVIGSHNSGQWYAKREVDRAATPKNIRVHWWQFLGVEDRKAYINQSEVLRPTSLPHDPLVQAYAQELARAGYPPVLRKAGIGPGSRVFSAEARRHILEQTFLRAGVYIRAQCQNPSRIIRPLGFMALETLGFGALSIMYRNCANNCPLALWWGDPLAHPTHPLSKWYPLFPRKVNEALIRMSGPGVEAL